MMGSFRQDHLDRQRKTFVSTHSASKRKIIEGIQFRNKTTKYAESQIKVCTRYSLWDPSIFITTFFILSLLLFAIFERKWNTVTVYSSFCGQLKTFSQNTYITLSYVEYGEYYDNKRKFNVSTITYNFMYFVSFQSKGVLGCGDMQLVFQQQKHLLCYVCS